MKIISTIVVGVLLSANAAGSLFAQNGEERPPVMQPRPRAPDPTNVAVSNFVPAYRKAGSPRMVVFWNREFSDEVSSEYRTVTEYEDIDDGKGMKSGRSSVGEQRKTTKRKALVEEAVDWDLEGSFNQMLGRTGANMVDRASIMRTQGVQDGAEERANVQAVETRAVTGKADLMVEILRAADQRSADGITFRIIVRDVNDARILADFTTDGRPPTPRMGLIAGPDGYERAKPPAPGPDDIGRQLAVELMQALTRSWR
jgi:hypothetical protein